MEIKNKAVTQILNEKDYAAVIRQIFRNLSDSLREIPANIVQRKILDELLRLADRVEEFHK